MKLKHQALSAVSATALLIAASAGLLALGGTRASFADPIDPAAVSALQSAVSNPNADLAGLITQMNSEVPGSGTQFAQAFQNTDTDALANALAALAGSNAALQSTIESALTSLSQNPSLASVSSGGQTLNVANVVSSINTTLSNQFAGNQNNNNNNGNSNNNNGDSNNNNSNDLANNLQNLNPGAGPNGQNPGFTGGSQFGSPFTTGNPNNNQGLSQSNQGNNSGNQGNPGAQNGPGQPNSRA
jgi:hypothetical protein